MFQKKMHAGIRTPACMARMIDKILFILPDHCYHLKEDEFDS